MYISEQIIQVLDDLCRRFGVVVDWSKEAVIPYFEELISKFIAFEVKTSYFWIFLGVALMVIAWIVFVVVGLIFGMDSDGAIMLCFAAIIFTIVLIIISGCQIYDIITCDAFPEKILLREIKELLQNAKNY